MSFKRLVIHEWKQFKSLDLNFHHRLTIVTGANASGKTTILNLLARHHGWSVPELSISKRDKSTGIFRFISRLFEGIDKTDDIQIGELHYENNAIAKLEVPKTESAEYSVQIAGQKEVNCFYIPSHRAIFRYQKLSQIPLVKKRKLEAFNIVSGNTKNKYFGGGQPPTSYFIKETLIGWSIFGYGNINMLADSEQIHFFNGFQEVLKNILPKSLGFNKFSIENMELVLVCNSGNFMIDGASGGISTLIDLAWQIFMYSADDKKEFVVLIDEVENHLHPTMQRRILPDFLKAFPTVKFIVSTHSPLIVSSVKDSSVYVLRQNTEGSHYSEKIDFLHEAKTASEVLDEALGVGFTMPIWAEEELMEIVNKYSGKEITKELLFEMRHDLSRLGLEKLAPKAISDIIDENDKA